MSMLERLTAALEGRYRVYRELGAGGMATVYLAHDLRHERDIATEVWHPDLGAAFGAERFRTEITSVEDDHWRRPSPEPLRFTQKPLLWLALRS